MKNFEVLHFVDFAMVKAGFDRAKAIELLQDGTIQKMWFVADHCDEKVPEYWELCKKAFEKAEAFLKAEKPAKALYSGARKAERLATHTRRRDGQGGKKAPLVFKDKIFHQKDGKIFLTENVADLLATYPQISLSQTRMRYVVSEIIKICGELKKLTKKDAKSQKEYWRALSLKTPKYERVKRRLYTGSLFTDF